MKRTNIRFLAMLCAAATLTATSVFANETEKKFLSTDGVTAYADTPVNVPPVPDAEGAVAMVHDFEDGEFDSLIVSHKNTDALGNSYQFKSGVSYASVVNAPAGHDGEVLKLDSDTGSAAYMTIILNEAIRQRCVLSFDVMTDKKPNSGFKDILKIAQDDKANTNRVITFLSTGIIQSNGTNFAPFPNYKEGDWYHFDIILHFSAADGSDNVIVQLTDPEGNIYRQDYAHAASVDQLKSLSFSGKTNCGSVYLDNLKIYKDVPSDIVMDVSGAPDSILMQNNTAVAKTFLFSAMLYQNDGFGPMLADVYSRQLELAGTSEEIINDCTLTAGPSQEVVYRLWKLEGGKIYQVKEERP